MLAVCLMMININMITTYEEFALFRSVFCSLKFFLLHYSSVRPTDIFFSFLCHLSAFLYQAGICPSSSFDRPIFFSYFSVIFCVFLALFVRYTFFASFDNNQNIFYFSGFSEPSSKKQPTIYRDSFRMCI